MQIRIALGKRRVDNNGKSFLVLFGLTGQHVSFECDNCGRTVEHRLPVRIGTDETRWFCSFPCANPAKFKARTQE